jgi:hypothetical protein
MANYRSVLVADLSEFLQPGYPRGNDGGLLANRISNATLQFTVHRQRHSAFRCSIRWVSRATLSSAASAR